MSKYRDQWFWQAVLSGGDVTIFNEFARVFSDIDARLAKLEAAWADNKSAEPGPAPTQREPGWYPVWSKLTGKPRTYWCDDGKWRESPGHIGLVDLRDIYEGGFSIGPRIEPPKEGVE